jgi:hypothetical protein
MTSLLYTVHCPNCLPGPGKPSPMRWELVLPPIQAVLQDAGCLLLKHWTRRHHNGHVRFQYAPLVYEGDLFYLQRWATVEWSVSPSQLIFPHAGWPCTEITRTHGNYLSFLVRSAIARLYPDATVTAPKPEPAPVALAWS